MVENLGIIGGGQLGSLLCTAAKKLNIKTIIFSDDENAPAQNFCNEFIFGEYDDQEKINLFTVISIILGLGLSCLFRKACDKRNCLVFKAPENFNDISKKTYKHNDKCYKFKPKSVTCDNSKQIVDFQ